MKKNFYVICSSSYSLLNFRFELLCNLSKHYNVISIAPDYDEIVFKKLKKRKINYLHLSNKKKIEYFHFFYFVFSILYKDKSDYKILSYTHIANIVAGISTFFKKNIKHYVLITGLGNIFLNKQQNIKSKLLYIIIKYLIKISLLRSECIIFQNKSDKNYYYYNILRKRYFIVNGSGVDNNYFKYTSSPKNLTFLMISRLVENKGIENFIKVAERFTGNNNIRFIFVGQKYKNYPLKKYWQKKLINSKKIFYFSWTRYIRKFYKKTSVYVLPSRREGMSRTILEAMSSGKAIITTNVPGCRELVINNYNGFVIKYNSDDQLYRSVLKFFKNKHLVKLYGKNSRKILLKHFSVKKVNQELMKIIS